MGFAELLLAGFVLTLSPAGEGYEAFLRLEEQWAARQRECRELRGVVERNGAESQALLERGDRRGARDLLRRTHELTEALTRCGRLEKELAREVEAGRRSLALELTHGLDRLLDERTAGPGRLAAIQAGLEKLEHVRPSGSCAVERFEEVPFTEEEDPGALRDKQALVLDLLEAIRRTRREHGEHLARLDAEIAMRRNLNGFLREMEVQGGGGLSDIGGLSSRDTKTLGLLEARREDCRRSLRVLEVMESEWAETLAALENLLVP